MSESLTSPADGTENDENPVISSCRIVSRNQDDCDDIGREIIYLREEEPTEEEVIRGNADVDACGDVGTPGSNATWEKESAQNREIFVQPFPSVRGITQTECDEAKILLEKQPLEDAQRPVTGRGDATSKDISADVLECHKCPDKDWLMLSEKKERYLAHTSVYTGLSAVGENVTFAWMRNKEQTDKKFMMSQPENIPVGECDASAEVQGFESNVKIEERTELQCVKTKEIRSNVETSTECQEPVLNRMRDTEQTNSKLDEHLESASPEDLSSHAGVQQEYYAARPQHDPGVQQEYYAARPQHDPGVQQEYYAARPQHDTVVQQDYAARSQHDPGVQQDYAARPQHDPGVQQEYYAARPQHDPGVQQEYYAARPQHDPGVQQQYYAASPQHDTGVQQEYYAARPQHDPGVQQEYYAARPQHDPGVQQEYYAARPQHDPGVQQQYYAASPQHDTGVSEGSERPIVSQRGDIPLLELSDHRHEMLNLAMDMRRSTDVLERQTCMTTDGFAMTARTERHQTHTRLYADQNSKGVTIQNSSNVSVSFGGQDGGTMENGIMNLKIKRIEEVFIRPEKFLRINKLLKTIGHVTLSGASGEGKTSLALMLGVEHMKHKYELVFVNDIDKFRIDKYIGPDRRVFLILDDIFGTVGLSTDVPQLKSVLHDLQLCLESQYSRKQTKKHDAEPKIRVVLTTKTYNLECGMSKLEGTKFFFFKGPTVIDLTRMKTYTFEDKKKIFMKHKANHDISIEFQEVYDKEQTMFGFPLTCELFFEYHDFQANPKGFFKEPLFYLRRELENLISKRNEQFAALVLMLLCDNSMDLVHVETEFQNTPISNLFELVQSMVPMATGLAVVSAARNFRGTIFTTGDIIGFSHPVIYDAFACALYSVAPRFVLENCSVRFLYERLNGKWMKSASVSDHLHILYASDAFSDIIAQRLAQAIEEGNYSMSLTHPILKNKGIVDKIFELLNIQKTHIFDRLIDTEKNKKEKMLHSQEQGKHLLYWAVQSNSLYLIQKVLAIGYNFSAAEISQAFEASISCGNLPMLQLLVSEYKEIKQSSVHEFLEVATKKGHTEMANYLLKICHDVTCDSLSKKQSVLLTAHTTGNCAIEKNIISSICRHRGISLSSDDIMNDTNKLLHFGCKHGDINLVHFICPVTDINKPINGFTPIMTAAGNGQREIFDLLLSKEADLMLTDSSGDSVIHIASYRGNFYIVQRLLLLMDLNMRGQGGLTPVMNAVLSGERDVFELFVSKGADLTLLDNYGDTVLHRACQGGNKDIVERLLPLFDVNVRGCRGLTAVMLAAMHGQRNVLNLLVSKGADLTLTDDNNMNVLHIASSLDDIYIVKLLLLFFDINIRGFAGMTPVMIAAFSGHRAVFELLVTKEADLTLKDNNGSSLLQLASEGGNVFIVKQLLPIFDVDVRNKRGWTSVMRAAFRGNRDVFEVLMSHGADLKLTDNDNNNVLHHASQGGDTHIVEKLLPLFDINIRGINGMTPVMIAVRFRDQKNIFDLFSSAGADLTLTDDNGNNVLHHACLGGDTCIVELLLPLFDINTKGQDGETPAMKSTLRGHIGVFDLLVSNGADCALTADNGNNILHCSCESGVIHMVETLLPLFDIDIRGHSGITPVMISAANGKRDVYNLLVRNGADLTLSDKYSDSILHHACYGGDTHIVEHLLSFFDINIRGNAGMTPVMIATIYGQKEVFDLLVLKGADVKLRNSHGNNALQIAIHNGDMDIIERIIPLIADIEDGLTGFMGDIIRRFFKGLSDIVRK